MTARSDLLWVEYHKTDGEWRPFSVALGEPGGGADFYDIEWCKSDRQLYMHMSGGGSATCHLSRFCAAPKVCAKLWVREGVPIVREVQQGGAWTTEGVLPEDARAMGYELLDAPLSGDPLDDASESETAYCGVCDDHLPREGGAPCRHLMWTENGYTGCGSPDVEERHVRRDLRVVFSTLNESELLALCDGLRGRHYFSRVDGWPLGSDWLTFKVGGRWSDGRGGGQSRERDAPPDVDDPATGRYLVTFPPPGGPQPTKSIDLGPTLTAIATERTDTDDRSGWMDGVSWLCSLCARDNCQAAEALTVALIEEWFANAAGFDFIRDAALDAARTTEPEKE